MPRAGQPPNTVRVRLVQDGKPDQWAVVPAEVIGPFAVHFDPSNRKVTVTTHVHTGLFVGKFPTARRQEAKRLAEMLASMSDAWGLVKDWKRGTGNDALLAAGAKVRREAMAGDWNEAVQIAAKFAMRN